MIIIKADGKENIPWHLVAKMMLNLEMNKEVYNIHGKLVNKANNHKLEYEGITYEFIGNRYNIYIEGGYDIGMVDCINTRIIPYESAAMKEMKDKFVHYSSESQDMELRMGCVDRCRHFNRDNKTRNNNDVYWDILKFSLLSYKGHSSRKMDYVMRQLNKFNSIVIDTKNILNFDKKITVLNRPLEQKDYTIDYLIVKTKPILVRDLFLYIYRLFSEERFEHFINHNFLYTINPIYYERMENLCPLRCSKEDIGMYHTIWCHSENGHRGTTH